MKQPLAPPAPGVLKQLIQAAFANATHLVSEADALSERRYWARTHFLASTALEELSKLQILADVLAGDLPATAVNQALTQHGKKFSYLVRQVSAPQTVSAVAQGFTQAAKRLREASLYVGLLPGGAVSDPSVEITQAQAQHTLQAAHDELSALNLLSLFPGGLSTKGAQTIAAHLEKNGA